MGVAVAHLGPKPKSCPEIVFVMALELSLHGMAIWNTKVATSMQCGSCECHASVPHRMAVCAMRMFMRCVWHDAETSSDALRCMAFCGIALRCDACRPR
eukprot:8666032-Lingulodinium_polyedra.AAC.1